MESKYTHEGFETFFNNLRMFLKMILYILIALSLVHLVLSTVLVIQIIGIYKVKILFTYLGSKLLSLLNLSFPVSLATPDGSAIHTTTRAIAVAPMIITSAESTIFRTRNLFIYSGIVYIFFPIILFLFKNRAKNQSKEKHLRGMKIITSLKLKKQMKKNREEIDLPFGDVKLPISSESRGTFIVGRPGSGKTTLMSKIIERLEERNEKAIIYDFKGNYLERFYRPEQDLIFNPMDKRSLGWNIFNEIKNYPDVDAVSASLIPPSNSKSDPFWNDSGRDVFAGILHYLFQNNLKTNKDIWQMVISDGSLMSEKLKKTKGAERGYIYVADASSKLTYSVLSVLMQHCKCFEFMSYSDGGFCVQDWLESGSGRIFITNNSDVQDTLKPIISLFIDLFCRRLLSMPETNNDRIYLLLDEFGTLQHLNSIVKLLTLSRSKGGSVFLGIQDFGQIDKIYSTEHRQSIVNACANKVIFGVNDFSTADYCSKLIGDEEILETNKSYSMGVSDFKDGTSLNYRTNKRPLFLPSELMGFSDLKAIAKFSNYFPVETKIRYKDYPSRTSPFEMKEDWNLESLRSNESNTDNGVEDSIYNEAKKI